MFLKRSDSAKAKHRLFINTLFAARPRQSIVCPRCGLEQGSEHDFCCACGTVFFFLDETDRYCV